MGRMAIMLKTVKENKETIEKAKLDLNVTKLPPGALGTSGNTEDVKQHVEHFINQYKADHHNEKFPIATYERRQSEI